LIEALKRKNKERRLGSRHSLKLLTVSTLFSCFKCALLVACNGSPKTQNIKDAIAHAESGKPLARFAAQQMPAVRE